MGEGDSLKEIFDKLSGFPEPSSPVLPILPSIASTSSTVKGGRKEAEAVV